MPEEPELLRKATEFLNPQDYASGPMSPLASFWTNEETEGALRASIRRYLKAGWKWVEGRLERKGAKNEKLQATPTPLMASRSGMPMFDPRTDAFALRLGAVFERPGRYRHSFGLMDVNGQFVPDDECPECGDMPWNVRIPVLDKWGKPVIPLRFQNTYCRRCVSRQEAEEAARRRMRVTERESR